MPGLSSRLDDTGVHMLKHLAATTSTFVIALGGVACFSAAPANADDAPCLVTDAKSVELVTDDEGVTTASVSLENHVARSWDQL